MATSKSKRGERFIFVGGCPRSGTTLVQNVLDCHPDICGAPEFMLAPDVMALRGKLHHSIDTKLIDKICSSEEADDAVASLLETLLLPLADRSHCRLLSEKSPQNVLVFRELMDLFPCSRFIVVLRDPRAIISSMFQVRARARQHRWTDPTGAFTENIFAAIAFVKRSFAAGFEALDAEPNRVTTLVYERLVAQPEEETKRLCMFLALDWAATMVHPEKQKHPGEEAITNKVWYDQKMYSRGVVSDEVDKWKRSLTVIQQALITRAFRKDHRLTALGYDFRPQNRLEALHCTTGVCLDVMGRVGRFAVSCSRSAMRLLHRYRADRSNQKAQG